MSALPTKIAAADVFAAAGAVPVNCTIEEGVLRPALAPVKSTGNVPQNVLCGRYCPWAGRYLLWAEGKVYSSANGVGFIELAQLTAQSPFIVEERTESGVQALVLGDTVAIIHTGEYQTARSFTGNLSCGVVRYGRLFGADRTDGFLLRWSGEGGALDWAEGISGAGWVYPAGDGGKILDVCDLNGKLVLVREQGLTRMNAYGTPENFAVEAHVSLPRAIAWTAAVAGGALCVCTENGLYTFDGNKARRVDDRLFDGLTPVYGVAMGENYLVCGNHAALGGSAVFVYDTRTGRSYLCDAPATALCVNGRAYAYGQGASYTLTEGGAPYRFTSGVFDFGSPRRKVVERLEIDCDEGVDITLSNGENSRIFEGVRGILRPNMRGFRFTVRVAGGCEVRGIRAVAEVEDGI